MTGEATTPGSTACVLHTGSFDPNGYGRVGRRDYAHRLAWAVAHGPVGPGLELHHVCENRACVNVAHLAAVTSKEHKALHAPTQCIHGHPFDAENTHVRSDNGRRECRACRRARHVRYRKGKAMRPASQLEEQAT